MLGNSVEALRQIVRQQAGLAHLERTRQTMSIGDMKFDVFGDTDPRKMPVHFFYGARKIRYESAVRADVARQNYSVCPRNWFIEAVFRCVQCKEEFTFSVREQRFWYETRKFYVDSYPTHCPKCRRLQRTRLELKQRYDAIIAPALSSQAAVDLKRETLQLIDAFAAGSTALPERMRRNRRLLAGQIAKRAQADAGGSSGDTP